MFVQPIVHNLKVLNYCHKSTSPKSAVIYWFHVPNIDSYSFYIPYLFIWSRCARLRNSVLLPEDFPCKEFCCSTDKKYRESIECFIKLFIVDKCKITLIVGTMVNISVYSGMAFINLCALKRDFANFYKGEFWGSKAFYSTTWSHHFCVWPQLLFPRESPFSVL